MTRVGEAQLPATYILLPRLPPMHRSHVALQPMRQSNRPFHHLLTPRPSQRGSNRCTRSSRGKATKGSLTRREKSASYSLVLKVIIHRRAFALRDALLLAVHLGHLAAGSGLDGLLVVAQLDEAREAEADALLAGGIDTFTATNLVAGGQREVGCL